MRGISAAAAVAALLALAGDGVAPASVPTMPADRVVALDAAPDGDVWFTTGVHLAVGVLRPDGTSRAWRLPGGFPDTVDEAPVPEHVRRPTTALVAAARNAGAWAVVPSVAGSVVYRVRGSTLRRVAMLPGFVWRVDEAGGALWLTGRRGMWRIRDGRRPRLMTAHTYDAVAAARGGGVWALRELVSDEGAVTTALERWTAGGRLSTVRLGESVDEIADDHRGGVWAVTELGLGLARIDGTTGRRTPIRCGACGLLHALAATPDGEAVATGVTDDEGGDFVLVTRAGGASVVLGGGPSTGRPVTVLADGRTVIGEPRPGRLAILGADGRPRSVRLSLPARPRARAAAAGDGVVPVVTPADGVRFVRVAGGWQARFGPRGARIHARLAGRTARLACTELASAGPGGLVRADTTSWDVLRVPRRRGTLTARLDVRRPDVCALEVPATPARDCDGGWCPVAIQAVTAEGRVRLDELQRTADVAVVFVGVVLATEGDRWPSFEHVAAALDHDPGELAALAGPEDTPARPGTVGYWTDGATLVLATRSTAGRRLFVRVTGDVVATNLPEWNGP